MHDGKTLKQKSNLGIYLHVPFCPHLCPYCSFVKTDQFTKKSVLDFFHSCEKQFQSLLEFVPSSEKYVTVYCGGGTPGLFDGKLYEPFINAVKSRFIIEEMTIETNPFTNSLRKFESYHALGFDRLTLGAQSLCPEVLKSLGRKHTKEDVLLSLKHAKEAGFENRQVDVIYGLKPGLRTLSLEEELQTLLEHGATGISTYGLTIEEHTEFYKLPKMANEDEFVKDYELIQNTLLSKGLTQLETSNFSYKDAKHNQIYWRGCPYLGIGSGAHGLLPPSDLHPYGQRYSVSSRKKSKLGDFEVNDFSLCFEKNRTLKDLISENVWTQLRTKEGLHLDWIYKSLGDFPKEGFELWLTSQTFFKPKLQNGFLTTDRKEFSDRFSDLISEQIFLKKTM